MFIAVPVGMNYRTERLPVVTHFPHWHQHTGLSRHRSFVLFNTGWRFRTLSWINQHLWLVPAESVPWWMVFNFDVCSRGDFSSARQHDISFFSLAACVEDLIGRRAVYFHVSRRRPHGGTGVCCVVRRGILIPLTPMGGASGAISACHGHVFAVAGRRRNRIQIFFYWFIVLVPRRRILIARVDCHPHFGLLE